MRLTLDALGVLDAIERHGSFAAAAEELHRVPSAITYAVQKLEEDLGVAIFDRSGHRAQLTEAGSELLREGRRLLAAAGGRADLVIGAPGDGPAGGGYSTRPLGLVQWAFMLAPAHPLADAPQPLPPEPVRG